MGGWVGNGTTVGTGIWVGSGGGGGGGIVGGTTSGSVAMGTGVAGMAVSVGGRVVAVKVAVGVEVCVPSRSFKVGKPATNPMPHSKTIATTAPIAIQNQVGRFGFSSG
jgi:hypothetical protein